jgi:HK97 family phage major capsid protein
MESLTKLFEQRARIHEQLKDRAKDWEGMIERGEDIPEDQNTEFDKWNADYTKLDEQISRVQKFEAIEQRDTERVEQIQEPEKRDLKKEYNEAFNSYLEGGARSLDHNQIKTLKSGFVSEKEGRAATASGTTSGAVGGYTVPEDFSYEVEKFAEFEGPFAGNNGPARIWTSQSGADMPWPTVDDTANDSYLLAEAGDATTSATGITFGTETLKAYKFNTGVIPVNDELIQDNFGGFLSLLAELLGSRQGRGKNTACTTGTGSSQPEGVTIGSSQGKYAASSTAFTQQEMIDLLYSVNKAYRMGPNVGFMMNPLIVGEVRKLDLSTSNYTQPLFTPSLQDGQPARILGYPYWENGAMSSAMTTGSKVMLFGDFSKFVIRNVAGFVVKRSDEIYFETGQVAYMGWSRFDSRVMNTNAIKYLDLT